MPGAVALSTMAMAGPSHVIVPGAGYDTADIIDVSNPDAPLLAGALPTRYTPAGILVDGDLAYVRLNSGAVDIFDIADLTAPVLLGSLTGGAYAGAVLIGQQLICASDDALSVFDVAGAHLAYPTVGTYNWGWGFSFDAERHGDHVYLASNLGLQVFDVSDYTAPQNTFGAAGGGVALVGDHLYVGHTDGLTVYGLADPAHPTELAFLDMAWWSAGVELEAAGDLLLVSLRDSLVTFDLTDPVDPRPLGSRAFQVNTFELSDGLAYVLSDTALHILDLSDPIALPQLGQVYQPDGEDLAVGNGFAYTCHYPYSGGLLWVTDVRDPTRPEQAHVETGIYLRGLSLHGDLLLGTQGGWGVQLMDVSDPTQPAYSGHLYHGYDVGWAYRARVVGDIVWIGSDEGVAFLPVPCLDLATTVTDEADQPRPGLAVSCYPNPFNPRVSIGFAVARRGPVDLAVFDLRGRCVARLLASQTLEPGPHTFEWPGEDDQGRPLASGTYLARVRVGERQAVQKMSLIR
jgi:hypothetical protein